MGIKMKRSAVAAKVPTTSDLELGELAVNTRDGKLYLKKDDGTASIVEVGPVTSVAGRTGAVSLAATDVELGTSATPQFASVDIGNASDTTVTRAAAGVIAVEGQNVLTTGTTQTITKGYTVTPNNIGSVSSGSVTPSAANGNYQYYTSSGAHTLAAPSADCAIDILITNGASAGAITVSGFTVGSATGSALTTTNGHRFLVSIRRINGVSTYSIYALQ
jgi:hypothetical protein